jgi:hypothetical protein
MAPFVEMPASELRDRWVPVDAVWRRSSDRIRNQIGDTASPAETLRMLEEELPLRRSAQAAHQRENPVLNPLRGAL